jgi:hydroxymethylpyrimidine kinase/phosphomethylpyrimidine kinase
MLGTKEIANIVGDVLREIKSKESSNNRVWIVLDPVMISTSGSKLIDDDAIDAIVQNIFPLADVVTPNKFEAEALLKRKLNTPEDVERGAQDLIKMGCKGVLIKGGHTLTDEKDTSSELKATITYAQDYLLTSEDLPQEGDQRLCDGASGVWLRTKRCVVAVDGSKYFSPSERLTLSLSSLLIT